MTEIDKRLTPGFSCEVCEGPAVLDRITLEDGRLRSYLRLCQTCADGGNEVRAARARALIAAYEEKRRTGIPQTIDAFL